MLAKVKRLFRSKRDANGRRIDQVINSLATQDRSSVYAWSYIEDQAYYQNTVSGKCVYLMGISKKAA